MRTRARSKKTVALATAEDLKLVTCIKNELKELSPPLLLMTLVVSLVRYADIPLPAKAIVLGAAVLVMSMLLAGPLARGAIAIGGFFAVPRETFWTKLVSLVYVIPYVLIVFYAVKAYLLQVVLSH